MCTSFLLSSLLKGPPLCIGSDERSRTSFVEEGTDCHGSYSNFEPPATIFVQLRVTSFALLAKRSTIRFSDSHRTSVLIPNLHLRSTIVPPSSYCFATFTPSFKLRSPIVFCHLLLSFNRHHRPQPSSSRLSDFLRIPSPIVLDAKPNIADGCLTLSTDTAQYNRRLRRSYVLEEW